MLKFSSYLIGYSISPFGLRSTSNCSSGLPAASSNDIFGRFLNNRTLFGCELSLAPMIVMPLSFMLPVNGIFNRSSSSASLSTNYQKNYFIYFFKPFNLKKCTKFTLSKFNRSSYGLKMYFTEPSTVSFKHSRLSTSIFLNKLY